MNYYNNNEAALMHDIYRRKSMLLNEAADILNEATANASLRELMATDEYMDIEDFVKEHNKRALSKMSVDELRKTKAEAQDMIKTELRALKKKARTIDDDDEDTVKKRKAARAVGGAALMGAVGGDMSDVAIGAAGGYATTSNSTCRDKAMKMVDRFEACLTRIIKLCDKFINKKSGNSIWARR